MLWIKAFHLIFMVTWFAGLFYLPRLFVYHAESSDKISLDRFKIMERKLYYGIMTPALLGTLLFGFWMLQSYAWQLYKGMGWLHLKLALIFILILFHFYCDYLRRQFQKDKNKHSSKFYRWLNEFPVLILVAVILLSVLKPF